MSSQLFKAAPGIFGDGDGLSFLQGANRVLVGGPLDVIDEKVDFVQLRRV